MNEIYWITRLDGLSTFFGVVSMIATIVVAALLIGFALCDFGDCRDDTEKLSKYLKRFPFALLFWIPALLIPDSKEGMLIWGVGSTIDYIKSNETIYQLPDKCVNALDAWVDSLTDKEHKDEN